MPALKRRRLNGTPDSEEAAVIKRHESAAPPERPESPYESANEESAEEEEEQTTDVQDSRPETFKDLEEGEQTTDVQDSRPKTFKDLGIIDELCDAVSRMGYIWPTAIQEQAIPAALEGKDVIGLAETGSGKTAAFALPILQALMEKPQPFFALVLAPTRELAIQTSQSFEALGALIAVRSTVLVGGMDMVTQAISLSRKPHIICAAPGRLLDHLENTKGFSLRQLKYLVLDEADRLLDNDFGDILDKILKNIPGNPPRKTMLFSATWGAKVASLQRASLKLPVRISISSDTSSSSLTTQTHQTHSHQKTHSLPPASLKQFYLFFPFNDKEVYLIHLLTNPPLASQTLIIFSKTIASTTRLSLLLRALGLSAIPLHGQLSQSTRLSSLNKFRSRSRSILVATDVAARGLDIPAVDAVINYDLPGDSATYVHRVGRTARAGKGGRAISFVTQYDVELWQRIEAALGAQLGEFMGEGRGVDRNEVLALAERVNEAGAEVGKQMREMNEGKKGRGKRAGRGGGNVGRGRDDDREEED